MTRIATLATIAEREIGVCEEGKNGGTRIREYQGSTTLAPGEWPWCAAFVSWCLAQWLREPGNFEAVARSDDDTRRAWRCASARAFAWEQWARGNVKCLVLGILGVCLLAIKAFRSHTEADIDRDVHP